MRDTGCEGVVVRKQLVDASELTGECCLLLRIDNTALLAEKAVISLRTPFLSGEVKALCIPDAICDVIVGNVEGARGARRTPTCLWWWVRRRPGRKRSGNQAVAGA
ncbi:hypothetical protein PoB_005114000 [Plakobranchus ocellatus]|uniref:Uncharacterized protein n=1 Tax=Plakobranchus ocellatus TaxID=259542 RepID=A0AAV4BZ84_9GAST|nr:hypothetical protein PoB_005114000 [Plakobranchus ocellatus]